MVNDDSCHAFDNKQLVQSLDTSTTDKDTDTGDPGLSNRTENEFKVCDRINPDLNATYACIRQFSKNEPAQESVLLA